MNTPNKRSGFTLIELLVVISIMGLLASIILASLNQAKKQAQASAILQGFIQVRNAIELYRSAHGNVPYQYVDINNQGIDDNNFQVLGPILANEHLLSDVPQPPFHKTGPDTPSVYPDYNFAYDTSIPANITKIGANEEYHPFYVTCGNTPVGDYVLVADASRNSDPLGIFKLMNMSQEHVFVPNGVSWVEDTEVHDAYCITSP